MFPGILRNPSANDYSICPLSPLVRALPFPYRGALSIASDCEYLGFEFFEALMSFLNTDRFSAWGRGLSLEITSSLFFFSKHSFNATYFNGGESDAPLGVYAARFAEYLKSGWIDTNHAYGDFDHVGGFTRAHAQRYRDEMLRLGVTLEVFTNHGGACNSQNIGKNLGCSDDPSRNGDIRDSSSYHADIMCAAGTRYVWTQGFVFGQEPTVRERIGRALRGQAPPSQLLFDYSLQDERSVKGFTRFRSTRGAAPNFSSFMHQIEQIDWNKFYAANGAVIVYQHLGVRSRIGASFHPMTCEAVAQEPQLLNPFRVLAAERDKALLWVVGTARLLRYVEMVTSVKVSFDTRETCTVTSAAQGSSHQNTLDLSGLTIYCDKDFCGTVQYEGKEQRYHRNDKDQQGRYSITIHREKLPDIW
jgi:hypothetical protein